MFPKYPYKERILRLNGISNHRNDHKFRTYKLGTGERPRSNLPFLSADAKKAPETTWKQNPG